jgi:hypothetical protein
MCVWLKIWDCSDLREKLVLMRMVGYVRFVESIKVGFFIRVNLDVWLE